MTGEALVERTRALVKSLRDLTVRDAATVLIMGRLAWHPHVPKT